MKYNIEYYIVIIFQGVEPEPARGPYLTYDNMLKVAKRYYATKMSEEDSIFWLRVCHSEGKPQLGSFSRNELETADKV